MLNPSYKYKYVAKEISELTYREIMDMAGHIEGCAPNNTDNFCEAILGWADRTIDMYEKCQELNEMQEKNDE